mmetsp:Transcript_7830/g.10746  ORF Transcript_7830/g.10746 Transcript_7830/m.10746 type:complete len:313 (-) Transcript_7830:213-1151(-)|eukprot:CAMPEP_0185279902 /NCGR_PEP_ID=MMETSP1359-20130426/64727_1 /TAXON_ID=552665 /ORGANISM="Bigelowiella longifila, Strain CCMP242" /LENGTH=312 /DNA_ID=CAMNT_0027874935 /DNA_START=28 /DNA_END=969 /DNA_ORIENTATION=+
MLGDAKFEKLDDDLELVAGSHVELKEGIDEKSRDSREILIGMKNEEAKESAMQSGLMIEEPTFTEVWCEKGFISNVITFVILIIGLLMRIGSSENNTFARYVLTFGLFGFSGGVTNWLAVKMLFDKIPFLYGSGVIPRRFKEIREAVKKTIMTAFFNPEFLKKYLANQIEEFELEGLIKKTMESESMDKLIDEQLNNAFNSDEVKMLLSMAGVNPLMIQAVVPLLKPFITNMAGSVAPKLKEMAIEKTSDNNIEIIRGEIDKMMTAKLKLLTPEMVKKLLEEVMRKHLSWLVIWGNVFGALIGVFCAVLNIP